MVGPSGAGGKHESNSITIALSVCLLVCISQFRSARNLGAEGCRRDGVLAVLLIGRTTCCLFFGASLRHQRNVARPGNLDCQGLTLGVPGLILLPRMSNSAAIASGCPQLQLAELAG